MKILEWKSYGKVQSKIARELWMSNGIVAFTLCNSGVDGFHACIEAKDKVVHIEAQTYAVALYEKYGFTVCSEEFPEDGIPHVEMIWRKPCTSI